MARAIVVGLAVAFLGLGLGPPAAAGPGPAGDAGSLRAEGIRPAVVEHPASITVFAGLSAVFQSRATGVPVPTVQWEVSANGSVWAAVYGATANELTLYAVTMDADGLLYRAVFTNAVGSATSSAARLDVEPPPGTVAPKVTLQPVSVVVAEGGTASFTAAASGTPPPTVRWQESASGDAWADVPGAQDATLSIAGVAAQRSGHRFRAVFTNVAGSATTSSATLSVGTPSPSPTPTPTAAPTVVVTSPASGAEISSGGYFGVSARTTGVPPGATAFLTLNGSATATAVVGSDGGLRFERVPAQSGDYAVRIGPAPGTAVSPPFALSVKPFRILDHTAFGGRVTFRIATGNFSRGTVVWVTRGSIAVAQVKVAARGAPVSATVAAIPGRYTVRVRTAQGWAYGEHAGITTIR